MLLKKINFIYVVTAFFIIMGIIIRTKLLLLNSSYWVDTLALAENITKPYFDFFKPLEFNQVAPPFFMVISKFIFCLFDNSNSLETRDFALRIFPYLCGIVSLPLFAVMLQKLYKNQLFTLIGTFLLSFNQYAIYYSVEFKQYSCELFFSILLILMFILIKIDSISLKKLSLYSVVFTIAPWFSHTAWLIIFSGFLYIIIEIAKLKMWKTTKTQVLLFPFYINLLVFTTQYYEPINRALYVYMQNYWEVMLPSFFKCTNFITVFPQKMNNLIPLATGIYFWIFLIFNVILLFLKNKKIAVFLLLPFICTVLASFFNLYPFDGRLILFLLPIFIVIYVQLSLFLNCKKYKIITYSIIIILSFFAIKEYNKQLEDNLILQSNSRELFYLLKEKNPTLKNVITYDVAYPYQSGKNDYLKEKHFTIFQNSNIPKYFSVLESGTYWIYIPFAKKGYIDDLKEYLKTDKKIISTEIFEVTDKKHRLADNEKGAFIAKVEI